MCRLFIEGSECESDIGILRLFIPNLNLGKLPLKLNQVDLFESFHIRKSEGIKNKYDSNILRFSI